MRGCWSESKVYGGAAARGRVFHPIQQASPSRSSSHTSRSRWKKEAWQEAEQKTSRETACKEGKLAQHHSSPATTTGPRDRHSPQPAAGDSQQQHHSAYSRSCRKQCTPATVKTTCYLLCCPRSSRDTGNDSDHLSTAAPKRSTTATIFHTRDEVQQKA